MKRKIKHNPGDVVRIPLKDGLIAYGRVIDKLLFAVYEYVSSNDLEVSEVVKLPVKYILMVNGAGFEYGRWQILENKALTPDLQKPVSFWHQDMMSEELSIVELGGGLEEEKPATREECDGLEVDGIWAPHHVEERLIDEHLGKISKWVESIKIAQKDKH